MEVVAPQLSTSHIMIFQHFGWALERTLLEKCFEIFPMEIIGSRKIMMNVIDSRVCALYPSIWFCSYRDKHWIWEKYQGKKEHVDDGIVCNSLNSKFYLFPQNYTYNHQLIQQV